MKVAIIARSTLYRVPGGDTVQAVQTARHLTNIGIDMEVHLCDEDIHYNKYDLLHFFNITRPADILYHSKRANKPFVVSTILCNYSEYDKYHRKKAGLLFSMLPTDSIEYLKTMARWLLGKDHLSSIDYVWKGQRRSIMDILRRSAVLLPNSRSEYNRLKENYSGENRHLVIPNGVDPCIFKYNPDIKKDEKLVLCVARIEGIKNQLNLIKALNNTEYRLLLIGSHSPNQSAYYEECRAAAADNVTFIGHIPQQDLVKYYQQAKVHVLPSWFETTGLSSIEAGAMGCNIVITDRGDAKEYFGSDAFYCDPDDPKSMFRAVKQASMASYSENLGKRINEQFTWKEAAVQTLKAYQTAIVA
jgi:glycosyltransferase involved in cell wall biosynthesis